MFFWKDKEKNKPTIIEHPVLGTLIKKQIGTQRRVLSLHYGIKLLTCICVYTQIKKML